MVAATLAAWGLEVGVEARGLSEAALPLSGRRGQQWLLKTHLVLLGVPGGCTSEGHRAGGSWALLDPEAACLRLGRPCPAESVYPGVK